MQEPKSTPHYVRLTNLQHTLYHGFAGFSDPVTFALELEVEDLGEGGEEGEEEVIVQSFPGATACHVQPHT